MAGTLNIQPVFDLSGGIGGGFNPHWLNMTPTLVTENFWLGVSFDPPVPIQQDQHNVQMRSHHSLLITCTASASVCGRGCIQLLRFVIRVMSFVFCSLYNETQCPMINYGYVSAPLKYISSKSWWMASSFSSFSYRRQFNTHNTAKLRSSSVLGGLPVPQLP